MKKIFIYIISIVLLSFGLLTLFLSSSIIFDLFEIRAKEGHYVLFIVWANFICSILYLFSAYGLIKYRQWITKTLSIASTILILAFIGLLLHIKGGGAYEVKTIGAMILRITITLLLTIISYFFTKKHNT